MYFCTQIVYKSIQNASSWPHTHPIRGATLNLFQKTWVLGSGNWVRLRSAKSGEGVDSEDYLPLTSGDGSLAVGSVAVGSGERHFQRRACRSTVSLAIMDVMKTESQRGLCTVPEVTPAWACRPLTQHRMAVTKLGFLSALTRRLVNKTTFSRFETLAKKPSVKVKRAWELGCL